MSHLHRKTQKPWAEKMRVLGVFLDGPKSFSVLVHKGAL